MNAKKDSKMNLTSVVSSFSGKVIFILSVHSNIKTIKHIHGDNIPCFSEVIHCIYKKGSHVRSFESAYFCMLPELSS